MSLKLAPFGMVIGGEGLAGVLVADVLDEQQDEDVVLVLAGVHAAAQFVAARPEGGVEFGFLEGHFSPSTRDFWQASARAAMRRQRIRRHGQRTYHAGRLLQRRDLTIPLILHGRDFRTLNRHENDGETSLPNIG